MVNGFIDIQVNGWDGVNFSSLDLTLDEIRQATRALVARGTLAYCPTIISSPWEVYERNLPLLSRAMEDSHLRPHLLGIHLEGPFIKPIKGFRGAHLQEHILQPDTNIYDQLKQLASGNLVILTLAPEIPGGIELIEHAKKKSPALVISLAHHGAVGEELDKAVSAGAVLGTHLGNGIPNGMRGLSDEPTRSELAMKNFHVSLITDGIHLPEAFIKGALKAKGPEGVIVTSDASPFAGLPPGEYESAGFSASVWEDGSVHTPDGEFLAGSGACMQDCMNHLASLGILSEVQLWQVGRDNPLALLGQKLDANDYQGLPRAIYQDNSFVVA
jgi:N-acetylglucosamine-6-phosphate deacetylase